MPRVLAGYGKRRPAMMSDWDLIDEIALAFVEAMNNQPGPLSAAKELLATLRASGRLAPEISDEDDYPDIMEGSLRAFGVPEEIATGRLRIHLAYVIYDAIERFSVKAPAVEEDVVEQAKLLIWGNEVDSPYVAFNKAVALIAAATEARICAMIQYEIDYRHIDDAKPSHVLDRLLKKIRPGATR